MYENLAALWSRIAADHPLRPAFIHGDRTLSWSEFDVRAAALAGRLSRSGVRRGEVVALALPNRPEHLISLAACLRIGLTPANINYHYAPQEIADLLALLQPRVIMFDSGRVAEMDKARGLLGPEPDSLWIMDGGGPTPAWALPLRPLLEGGDALSEVRSGPDDVLIKCTGGTTGRPAAVRWKVRDLARNVNLRNPWLRRDDDGLPDTVPIPVADARIVVASPLMHGSGQTRALGALCAGGTVITLPRLAPSLVWGQVAHHQADTLAIVGDAMARPLADALDRQRHAGLPHLCTISSSGAPWTAEVKQRLLVHLPQVRLVETLGATEATGLGTSIAVHGSVPATGTFKLGGHAAVIRPDGRLARAGEDGLLGVTAPLPLGLHPAGQLPATRFVSVDGTTYLLSGDHAHLLDEENFLLLGRSDECVNIGGEKVYTPEVAQAALEVPSVQDVAVVPLPHPVQGHTLVALVELDAGTVDDVRRHLQQRLAAYKVPRLIVRVDAVPRTAAGKVDAATARAHAERAYRISAPPRKVSPIATRAATWDQLVDLAEQEQLLLERALASLFANAELDRRIGKALGYPDWPQPLTLLPSVAAELSTATEQLANYLDFSAQATAEVVQAVGQYGWPRVDRDGATAADAVWLLTQHADLAQDSREELLAEATRSAATRRIDGRHLALLDDRVQSLRGKPQRYGTFVIVRDEQPRFLYPVDGPYAQVDRRRTLIGMPPLSQDLTHAYSPITPYGAGRTTPGNPFVPSRAKHRPLPTASSSWDLTTEPVPDGAVPVYLAATLRHRNEVRRLREQLPEQVHPTSRSLDLDPLTRPSCQFDAGIALNRLAARLCLDDIRRSKVVIAMEMSKRSAGLSSEMGCALATGVPVVYVGKPSCSFDMLPEVTLVPDVEAAIEAVLSWFG